MARTLRYLGLVVLAVGAWLLIAEEAHWMADESLYVWTSPLLKGGAALFLAGWVLAVLAPMTRTMFGTRCVRCSRSVPKGQTYCADHLRETVQEYRDRIHDRGY